MISKPRDAVRNQATHQEDTISAALIYLEKEINDHLSKYPDAGGTYTIDIPMNGEMKDFHFFWDEGLKDELQKRITEAGWDNVDLSDVENETMMGTSHLVRAKLEVPNAMVEELEKLRQETAEQHTLAKTRKAKLNHPS